jgi:hypothetical protein
MKLNILSGKIIFLATVLFFAFTINLHAQEEDDTEFEDDVNDEAPIDSLIYAGLIGGAILGYRLLRKGETE